MYSQGCSAGVQLATAVVVPQVCAPPAAHSVRTGAEPPVHHLCTRPVHPGLGPLVFPLYTRVLSTCAARAAHRLLRRVICLMSLRWEVPDDMSGDMSLRGSKPPFCLMSLLGLGPK